MHIHTVHWLSVLVTLALTGMLQPAAARAGVPALTLRALEIITVTTVEDELNSDGDCALREAVLAANHDQPVGGCPAGQGADTILLPSGVYTLALVGDDDTAAAGDLDLLGEVTIQGVADTTVINGNGEDRVLHVLTGAKVTLTNLTIQGGVIPLAGAALGGGGILNAGELHLSHVLIAGNGPGPWEPYGGVGGGVANSGVLSGDHVELRNNRAGSEYGAGFSIPQMPGGGIYSTGVLTLSTALITGNYGGNGAGISNAGVADVRDSEIRANRSRGRGAGIFNAGQMHLATTSVTDNTSQCLPYDCIGGGGGIANLGSLDVDHSLVAHNNAYYVYTSIGSFGGGILNSGTLTLTASTVYSNTIDGDNPRGGGLYNAGIATIENSTFSANLGPVGGGLYNSQTLTIRNSTVTANVLRCGGDPCPSGASGGAAYRI
jgi:CSLREA domain-containing protein